MPGLPGHLRQFSDPVNGAELQEPYFGRGENPPYPSLTKVCALCRAGDHSACDERYVAALMGCHCWRAYHDPVAIATLYDERPGDYNLDIRQEKKERKRK